VFGGKGRLWSDKRRTTYLFSTSPHTITHSTFTRLKNLYLLTEPACFTGVKAPLKAAHLNRPSLANDKLLAVQSTDGLHVLDVTKRVWLGVECKDLEPEELGAES
jgi:hypothetical protein